MLRESYHCIEKGFDKIQRSERKKNNKSSSRPFESEMANSFDTHYIADLSTLNFHVAH
jgi:hypothetical protein